MSIRVLTLRGVSDDTVGILGSGLLNAKLGLILPRLAPSKHPPDRGLVLLSLESLDIVP